MSERATEDSQTTQQQGAAIVQDAIAEYESIMTKKEEPEALIARRGANPPRSRNVLGRGLSALMSVSAVQVEPPAEAQSPAPAEPPPGDRPSEQPEGALSYLPIDRIVRNETQPRQQFDGEEIEALCVSIKQSGLLQPIIVRRKSAEAGPLATYEIVAGERRWRAAQQAGLSRIPALVRQLGDRETLELAIVENVQRAELNPVEQAQAFQRLITEFGATQEEVAQSVGKDRASVANALRLLRLEPEVLDMLRSGRISAGHGRALLMTRDGELQRELAERIIAEQLSVRAAEQLAGRPQAARKPSARSDGSTLPAQQELEERFRRALGTKVKLSASADGKGELRIRFFSEAELQSLLEKLGA